MSKSDNVVRLDAVTKRYGGRAATTTALDAISLGLRRGSFTAVMGPSGSGKSTLLHCAAGLDRPTAGTVTLDGVDLTRLPERALARLRRERVGFVFQSFNLLPELSAADNVALPLRLSGRHPRRAQVTAALDRVGLAAKRRARPGQLSGGQQQRVAIARALLGAPSVVFADEPTGALDSATAAEVLGLLRRAVQDGGTTVVMVTHDPVAAAHADRVVFLADGRIAGELRQPTAEAVAARMTHLTGRAVSPALSPAVSPALSRAVSPAGAQAGPSW
ncbi:MAG TPA: ABC transporter ATP-binding protein [Streptosporangiaceae bacterium]